MAWIFWATLGYFFNAVAISVDKALLNRQEMKDPAVYTLLISTLGLLVLLLLPFGFEWPSWQILFYGLSSGFFFTLGLWLMFTVLRAGEASRVPAFIGSLNPLFVFVSAYFLLNERLGFYNLLAFVLLLAGGLLMAVGRHGLKRKNLWLGIVSAAAFGVAYVFLKMIFDETSFISGLIWTRLGGFVSSLLLLLLPGILRSYWRSLSSGGQVKLAFVGGQATAAIGGILNSYAIALASVTLVNALQGIQYVFLLIIAAAVSYWQPIFFHDEFSHSVLIRKIVGTVLIATGLGLLSVM